MKNILKFLFTIIVAVSLTFIANATILAASESELKQELSEQIDAVVQSSQRANEIQPDIRLYVETAVELGYPLAKFEPVSGMYLGFFAGGLFDKDNGEADFFTNLGFHYNRQHAMYLTYVDWTSKGVQFPEHYTDRLKGTNKAVQIALEPSEGLDIVKDGQAIRKFAKQAKKAGNPIFLRFAGDMNVDSEPWYNETDGSKYIEKFRLMHDIFEEEAPNVAMVWAPNATSYGNTKMYYPGDQYVDWIGVSLYMNPVKQTGENLADNPFQYFDEWTSLYPNKPFMYAEGAVSHYSFINNKNYSDWAKIQLYNMFKYVPKMYPQVKAITYFNQNEMSATQLNRKMENNYDLARSATAFNTFGEIVKDPFLIDEIKLELNNSVMTAYKEISQLKEGSGMHNAFIYTKLPEGQIAHRVAVYQNNKKVAESNKLPFEFQLDLNLLDTSQPIRVVAYDANGREVVTETMLLKYKKVGRLSNFTDLSGSHWAFDTINAAVKKGIINGYNGKFRPEDHISVQEFVTILARIYGKNSEVSSVGDYQQNVVNFMKSINLPYANQPDLQLNRTQVAEIIAASQGLNFSGEDAIKYLLVNGFSKGKVINKISVENYLGNAKLSRAEAVKFLDNIKEVGTKTIQTRPFASSDSTVIREQYRLKFAANYLPPSPNNPYYRITVIASVPGSIITEREESKIVYSYVSPFPSGGSITEIKILSNGRGSFTAVLEGVDRSGGIVYAKKEKNMDRHHYNWRAPDFTADDYQLVEELLNQFLNAHQ